MDAFAADVLIYAAVPGHSLGRRVRALFPIGPDACVGVGSVLLLPEVLAEPLRDGSADEVAALAGLLGRLELRSVDPVTAEVATTLAAVYRLRAPGRAVSRALSAASPPGSRTGSVSPRSGPG